MHKDKVKPRQGAKTDRRIKNVSDARATAINTIIKRIINKRNTLWG